MMTSRARRAARASLATSAIALAVGVVLVPSGHVRADGGGGSIVGQIHVSEGDVGGGGTIDLWGTLGPLRLGGFFGVAAIPSEQDWRNRTMMMAGAHASLAIDLDVVDVVLVARGGMFGGATQEAKLLAGGVVGGGAYLDVAIDGGVAIGGGAELLGVFGGGDTWTFVPALRLTWGRLASEPERPAAEETAP